MRLRTSSIHASTTKERRRELERKRVRGSINKITPERVNSIPIFLSVPPTTRWNYSESFS
jgi:hypothetical protein